MRHVLLTGAPELYQEISTEQIKEVARDEHHSELLRALGLRSMLMVPLRLPRRVVGVMTLATDIHAGDWHSAMSSWPRSSAGGTVAVENSRLHTALATVAETLQQELLPSPLPSIPGWDLAGLYRPTQTEQRIDVGGDFYELFSDGEQWFAIVGDVTGKGVSAASLTALLRYGARVACRTEHSPAAVLTSLDEALAQRPKLATATGLCLQLNDDHVIASSAGHPPAIVVSADGILREVPQPDPMLGAFRDVARHDERVSIHSDEILVAYTDGVTDLDPP